MEITIEGYADGYQPEAPSFQADRDTREGRIATQTYQEWIDQQGIAD